MALYPYLPHKFASISTRQNGFQSAFGSYNNWIVKYICVIQATTTKWSIYIYDQQGREFVAAGQNGKIMLRARLLYVAKYSVFKCLNESPSATTTLFTICFIELLCRIRISATSMLSHLARTHVLFAFLIYGAIVCKY